VIAVSKRRQHRPHLARLLARAASGHVHRCAAEKTSGKLRFYCISAASSPKIRKTTENNVSWRNSREMNADFITPKNQERAWGWPTEAG
jgi:hypothetical protein